jgi:hypothetical protein
VDAKRVSINASGIVRAIVRTASDEAAVLHAGETPEDIGLRASPSFDEVDDKQLTACGARRVING